MKYMLDTNICIYIIKKHPESVLKKLVKQKIGDVCISAVTFAELMVGVEKSLHHQKNKSALEEFVSPFEMIPFDDVAAIEYGKIRAVLEKKGKPIGSLDMLIAAHALSLNMILVTNNMKEFSRVPHLKIENWVIRN